MLLDLAVLVASRILLVAVILGGTFLLFMGMPLLGEWHGRRANRKRMRELDDAYQRGLRDGRKR